MQSLAAKLGVAESALVAAEALEYAGRWLDTNGEAVYATRAMPARGSSMRSSYLRKRMSGSLSDA